MYDHRPPVDLAELLVDEHLLEHRPSLTADLDRQRAAVEAGLDRRRADRRAPCRAASGRRPLELDLERLEDLAHERAGARLELELVGRQSQVHRRQGCATRASRREPRQATRSSR